MISLLPVSEILPDWEPWIWHSCLEQPQLSLADLSSTARADPQKATEISASKFWFDHK